MSNSHRAHSPSHEGHGNPRGAAGHSHGGHGHSHGSHGHSHGPPTSSAALGWSLLLVLGFGLLEIVVGLASGSLALASDGVHMLADALALAIAWGAQRLAPRGAGPTLSFGWARIEPLAAFTNAIFYVGVLVFIVYEASVRLAAPQPIATGIALPVAIAGLLMNAVIWRMLHGGRDRMNTRAALLHVIGDFAASAIAIVALATVRYTGWTAIDPLLSLAIAALLLLSTIRLIRDTSRVLLNGVPHGLASHEIGDALLGIDGVAGYHDLHVWSIGESRAGLAVHVQVAELADWPGILEEARAMLHDRFGISHVTLQAESAGEEGACGSGCDNAPGGGSAPPSGSRTGTGTGNGTGIDTTGTGAAADSPASTRDPGGAMALRLERELDAQSALVARVLREDIGSQLTTLRTLAASFEARQSSREPAPSELLATLILRQADSLIESVRALVSQVRPDALSSGGLPEALRGLAADWRLQRPGKRIEVLIDPPDDADFGLAASAVETAALQAAAVALSRAFGDGHAHSVVLDVSHRDGQLVLQLADDGAPPGRAAEPGGVPAWFAAPATRIAALGGETRVGRAEGGGTSILVHLPWESAASAPV